MKKSQLGGYTPVELADHIDNEGGIASFFIHYSDPRTWIGSAIEQEVKAFREAHEALHSKLSSFGALL